MANPRMTAEIGRVLGGRYRLVAPIGMGASAQVYLADDVKLRRRVALKMLHDALAGDAEFLRRFRAEARAAAALSHPNVMAVYDWSDGTDEGEVAFIVTEYLAGGSLRALLDSGAQLSPSQALAVGLEAARALDYAHRRGFVHRDIKPANLLFGEEQRLRIADFGLARALAEAAWTEPQGAVLGTARYASPEQAKGESLTGKADVYSLALVMVEAVTGEVPFVADTTLGTLMARVDRPLVVPDALGPLQPVLAAAGHPDPQHRTDARTLAKALLRAAQQLPRPEPLPLVGAIAAGATGADDDPTIHAGIDELTGGAVVAGAVVAGSAASAAGASDLTVDDLDLEPPSWVSAADPSVGDDDVIDLTGPSVTLFDHEAEPPGAEPEVADAAASPEADADDGDETAVAAVPVAALVRSGDGTGEVDAAVVDGVVADDGDDDGVESPKRHRRWPWVALIVIVLAALGGGAAAMATRPGDEPKRPPVVLPVPDVVGMQQAEASELIEAGGWTVGDVEEVRRDGTTKGQVLASSPAAGARLDDGDAIDLTVSIGQTLVDVPTDLAGATLEDALRSLEAASLKGKIGDTPFSEDVPKDSVISVAEGTPGQLEKGSTVTLVVSKGPEPRPVPAGLVGSTEAAAKEAIAGAGLEAQVARSFSDDVPEGQVISVLPKSGTVVEKGSSVTIEVSRGPELIAVPDVSGTDSLAEAAAVLQAAGFNVGEARGPALGKPRGTTPKAGTMAKPGTTVDIRLG